MMQGTRRVALGVALAGATALLASYGGAIGTATRAEAGACYDLWYQRNAIFARMGHCFKHCGRRVWGRNCFPPYGKLSPGQWSRVRQIQSRERAMRCPACPQTWQ